jgi:hypothetical protein
MTQADSVLSTPPTNTSAIDQPMFPPRDPTRRRFLAISAGASFVGAGSLAAAAMAPNDVPQAVTVPIGPDPIYAVIEQHRKAAREHTEAIDLEAATTPAPYARRMPITHQNNRAAGPRNTRLLDPLARLIVQEFPSCARHRADKIIPQHQRQCRERLVNCRPAATRSSWTGI